MYVDRKIEQEDKDAILASDIYARLLEMIEKHAVYLGERTFLRYTPEQRDDIWNAVRDSKEIQCALIMILDIVPELVTGEVERFVKMKNAMPIEDPVESCIDKREPPVFDWHAGGINSSEIFNSDNSNNIV